MTEIPDSEDVPQQPTLKTVGYDDLMEDIFGLNLRGLVTIRDIFVRPKAYFLAAKTPDWGTRYTPSFRLLLGLFAIFAIFKIIYTNPESRMFQEFLEIDLQDPDFSGSELALKNATDSMKRFISWLFASLSFFALFSWCLFALSRRIWGTALSFVVTLRYVLALAVPAIIFILLSGIVELWIHSEHPAYIFSQAIINGLGFILVGMIAYRGPLDGLQNPSKILRAVSLTILINFQLLLALVVSALFAIVVTS